MPFQPGTHFVHEGEMEVRSKATVQNETATATAPPSKEKKSDSVTKRRASLRRSAPKATRKAISRWRLIMRAKSRFTRFAPARNKTNAAAACSKRKSGKVKR